MQEIKDLLAQLQAKREAIVAESKPLRDKRMKIQQKIQPLEDESRLLMEQIRAIEGDQLVKLDKSIGTLHRSLGAKSIEADTKLAE